MSQTTHRVSRRAVLRGVVGGLGVAALPLLQACGGPAPTPTVAPTPQQAAPPPTMAAVKPTEVPKPTEAAKPTAAPTTAPAAAATAKPAATAVPKPAAKLSGQINVNFIALYTHTSGWEAVAKKYMAIQPDVKVVVDLKPVNGYPEWLRAQFASGTPQVSLCSANYVQNLFYPDGRFLDLMTYLEKVSPYTGKPWKEDLELEALASPHAVTNAIYMFGSDNYQGVWFYNLDAFKKAGLGDKPPKDYDELLKFGAELKKAGYMPLAIEGDATAFNPRRVRWLHDTHFDQFSREWIEIYRAKPGDWNFKKGVDDVWKLDVKDRTNDYKEKVTVNNIRFLRAIRDKEIKVDTPQYREELTSLKKLLGPLTQSGWIGTADAYPLFVTQKAAMYIDVTSVVTRLPKDVAKLGADAKPFEFGAFNFPPMTTPLATAPTRGRESALAFYGVPKKDSKQNDLEMDFVMYFTSPEGFQTYLDASLDPKNPDGFINGTPTIKNVQLPDAVAKKFEMIPRIGGGAGQNSCRPLAYGWSDASSVIQTWVDLAQQFYADKIDMNAFVTGYQAAVEKGFADVLKANALTNADLDAPEKRPAQR